MKTKLLCRQCKEPMVEKPSGDFMGFLSVNPHYCQSEDCKYFGFLTVAGIRSEEEISPEK